MKSSDKHAPHFALCILGPQGSGKGTQATRLAHLLHIAHIAPGDIFRSAVSVGNTLGHTVEKVMNEGHLVPDTITNTLIHERLQQLDTIQGFILDGYPRNRVQADALDAMTPLSHVIVIDITDDEAVRRISLRRVCSACGHTTMVQSPASAHDERARCPRCSSALHYRDDDKPDAIRRRLHVYHTQTEPLTSRYEKRGILHRVNGMGSIDVVWQQIASLFPDAS